ncbi:MAG: saccharopine dehydrogenase [Halioglobus sp.]
MMSKHIWLRAETKPGEARAALTPHTARTLLESGFTVTVERSHQSVFAPQEYEEQGCTLVDAGTWPAAPPHAYILGLKELPDSDAPLTHQHIYFAHAYKCQAGWNTLLRRFKRGSGILLDLEYLVDDSGKRCAAFGYWAGFVGSALAILTWAGQRSQLEPPLQSLQPWQDKGDLLSEVTACLDRVATRDLTDLRMIIIGALGRVGAGARALAEFVKVPALNWDMAETSSGGPFQEILNYPIFLNCVLVNEKLPPFITRELVTQQQRVLSVIADISCDPLSEFNPIPLYDQCTTAKEPVLRLQPHPTPLDLIAIDNLPSLLPRESSEDFSSQLLPVILSLSQTEAPIWQRAERLFHHYSGPLHD